MSSGRLRILVVMLALAGGCKSSKATGGAEAAPITLRDESEGLLFTWVDDKGDAHTEVRATEVPLMGRDAVRVVDPSRDDGTHDTGVFIADLRNKRPDGTYTVRRATRAEFEALILERRKAHGPTLVTAESEAGPPRDPAAAFLPLVTIYGASWCGPCHQAAAYLTKKGVKFVEHDIESEPDAAREMREKLRGAGKSGGSIPVLDVKGHILIGFSASAVDAALSE